MVTMFIRTLFVVSLCLSQISAVIRNKESGLNESQQKKALDQHNYRRKIIAQGKEPKQPKASNMLKMKYDSHLAKEAQALSDTRIFEHNTVHDDRWFAVGQNLALTQSSVWVPGPNWTYAIELWFNEHKDFIYPTKKMPGSVVGHYTQLVWAKSWAVGCGYTAWYDPRSGFYNKYYACNYGPPGNWVGYAPYKIGKGCENLCDPPEDGDYLDFK